ncbi:MAG: sigma-70 family RNA polymerase sigma factor [Rikenellaceae bacterium]
MTNKEFNIYINTIHGRMMRFAKSILHNEADAEDVVSQVSERLWRERERLDRDSNTTSFAMRSIRNGCYDHTRFRQRRHHTQPDGSMEDRGQSDERCDTIELVRFAIKQLPERQREVIHLKDIEGYSTREMATILELEETNIRMILSRARRTLKEIIIKNMQ